MVELDKTPKLINIIKLINQWIYRKLTPIGRLEIIKKKLCYPEINQPLA